VASWHVGFCCAAAAAAAAATSWTNSRLSRRSDVFILFFVPLVGILLTINLIYIYCFAKILRIFLDVNFMRAITLRRMSFCHAAAAAAAASSWNSTGPTSLPTFARRSLRHCRRVRRLLHSARHARRSLPTCLPACPSRALFLPLGMRAYTRVRVL